MVLVFINQIDDLIFDVFKHDKFPLYKVRK
nr:MAG TPA: hypothetical protein [Caudoviricetes sp.]